MPERPVTLAEIKRSRSGFRIELPCTPAQLGRSKRPSDVEGSTWAAMRDASTHPHNLDFFIGEFMGAWDAQAEEWHTAQLTAAYANFLE